MSVIVPMRNAAEHVLEQVKALGESVTGELDFEVIWVDNGSSDGTLRLVAGSIRGDTGCAFSRQPRCGRHTSLETGELPTQKRTLLFCDADDVVDQHWVESMESALADVDVVGGALKSEADGKVAVPSQPRPTGSFRRRTATWEFAGGGSRLSWLREPIRRVETWRCAGERRFGLRFGFRPTPSF